jgi:hypothetical protein
MSANSHGSNRSISHAKHITMSSYTPNSLDRAQSLRAAFDRARDGQKQQQAVAKPAAQPAKALGPKNEPGMHLRPNGPERRAVDAQIHTQQLDRARAQANPQREAAKQSAVERAKTLREAFAKTQGQQKDRGLGKS